MLEEGTPPQIFSSPHSHGPYSGTSFFCSIVQPESDVRLHAGHLVTKNTTYRNHRHYADERSCFSCSQVDEKACL